MDHAENAQQPAGVDGWVGRSAVDRNGVALGVVTAVVPDPRGDAAWLTVAGAGVTGFVPSAGAEEAGGQVKVTVGRAQVVAAPTTTLPDRLSEFEAAALRRHYSRDAEQPASSGPDPVRLAAAAVALLAVVLWVVRRARRKPPTPAERLSSAGRITTAAVAHRAKDLASTAGSAAQVAGTAATTAAATTARAAAPVVGEVAHDVGELARRGAHAGAELATRAAAAAVPVATTAAGAAAHGVSDLASNAGELAVRAAHTGQRVGEAVTGTLAEVPEAVAERVEELHRTWRKVTNRLVFVVFLALGYVLGARAGTERYDAIMRLAGTVTGSSTTSSGGSAGGPVGDREPDLQPLSTTPPPGHTMG